MALFPTLVPKKDIAADSMQEFDSFVKATPSPGVESDLNDFDAFVQSSGGIVDATPTPTPAYRAPMPQATPAPQAAPGPQTTVALGVNPQYGQGGDTSALRSGIVDYARQNLGDEGAKAIDAVLETEGGLGGAIGDNGQSVGPFQFYRGGGQLNNLAKAMNVDDETAFRWVQANPLGAAKWAIDGYLGGAIREGQRQGLSGADLATHAQRTGQVSVSPERAGQNYARLYGGGYSDAGTAPTYGRQASGSVTDTSAYSRDADTFDAFVERTGGIEDLGQTAARQSVTSAKALPGSRRRSIDDLSMVDPSAPPDVAPVDQNAPQWDANARRLDRAQSAEAAPLTFDAEARRLDRNTRVDEAPPWSPARVKADFDRAMMRGWGQTEAMVGAGLNAAGQGPANRAGEIAARKSTPLPGSSRVTVDQYARSTLAPDDYQKYRASLTGVQIDDAARASNDPNVAFGQAVAGIGQGMGRQGQAIEDANLPDPTRADGGIYSGPPDPTKAAWWRDQVVSQAPFSLATIPVSIAGGAAGAAVGGPAGGKLGAAGSAATFEALGEMGQAYDDALKEGKTPWEASRNANRVFWANTAMLTAANAASGGLPVARYVRALPDWARRSIFSTTPEAVQALESPIKKALRDAGFVLVDAGGEAVQEVAQNLIQKVAADKEFDILDPENIQSAAAALGLTLVMGGVGAALNKGVQAVQRNPQGAQALARRLAPGATIEEQAPPQSEGAMFTASEMRPQMKGAIKGEALTADDLLGGQQFESPAAKAAYERKAAIDSGQMDMFGAPVEEAPAAKAPVYGPETKGFGPTDPNKSYDMRYRVVPLAELVASQTDTLGENPSYPKELQPRDRSTLASVGQMESIAARLNPQLVLEDGGRLGQGSPIVGSDLVVESGNGRVTALRLAALKYPEQWAAYQTSLREKAASLGVDPQTLAGMANPVLVRERTTPVDRVRFANEANASEVLQMNPAENAQADARQVSDDQVLALKVGENQTLDGALLAGSNDRFVSGFLATLPQNERAKLVADGELNADGVRRIKNALFAKTFGGKAGTRLVKSFSMSTDSNIKNVESALAGALGQIGRAEALVRAGARNANLAIGDDLAAAVDMFARIRAQGGSVADYLGKEDLFAEQLTPFQKEILGEIDKRKGAPKQLREMLQGYAARVEDQAPAEQTGFFAVEPPTKEELFRGAVNEQEGVVRRKDDRPIEIANLDAEPAARQPGQTGDTAPERAPAKDPAEAKVADFTADELAEFDRLGIDVSKVTADYKSDALQQLKFKQDSEKKLASPDYNQQVQAEYDRIAAARKEPRVVPPGSPAYDLPAGYAIHGGPTKRTAKQFAVFDENDQMAGPYRDSEAEAASAYREDEKKRAERETVDKRVAAAAARFLDGKATSADRTIITGGNTLTATRAREVAKSLGLKSKDIERVVQGATAERYTSGGATIYDANDILDRAARVLGIDGGRIGVSSSRTQEEAAPAPAATKAPAGRSTFLADKPAIQRQRANATLDEKVNYSASGKVQTRRAFVEDAARRGLTASQSTINAGPGQGTHWFIGDTQATKTEVDYLAHLKATTPSAPAASDATTENPEPIDTPDPAKEAEYQRYSKASDRWVRQVYEAAQEELISGSQLEVVTASKRSTISGAENLHLVGDRFVEFKRGKEWLRLTIPMLGQWAESLGLPSYEQATRTPAPSDSPSNLRAETAGLAEPTDRADATPLSDLPDTLTAPSQGETPRGPREEPIPAGEMPKVAAAKKATEPEAPYTAERFRADLVGKFHLTRIQARAVATITDARASVWAKATGRTKEEWHATRIVRVDENATPASESVLYQSTLSRKDTREVYSVERTSRPQIPAMFSRIPWKKGTRNLDVGGGRYDRGSDYLAESHGVTNLILDPYSRSEAHNDAIIAGIEADAVDSVTVANVLNVIKDPEVRTNVIREASRYAKLGAPIYFSVYYESGVTPGERGTGANRTWQEMRPLQTYLSEVQAVYPDAKVEGGYIVAHATVRLFQSSEDGGEYKGAAEFLDDGRAIIHAFGASDVSTALHELAHIFRRDLTGADLATAEAWVKAKDGVWSRVNEEQFARGFELYLREGKAPSVGMKAIFAQFKSWLSAIYQAVKGSPIDVPITDEMRRVYDRLLVESETPTATPTQNVPRPPKDEVTATPLDDGDWRLHMVGTGIWQESPDLRDEFIAEYRKVREGKVVIPLAELPRIVADLGLSDEQIAKLLLDRSKGVATAQLWAARRAIQNTEQAIKETQAKLDAAGENANGGLSSAEAEQATAEIVALRAKRELLWLAAHDAGSEAGRTLNSLRQAMSRTVAQSGILENQHLGWMSDRLAKDVSAAVQKGEMDAKTRDELETMIEVLKARLARMEKAPTSSWVDDAGADAYTSEPTEADDAATEAVQKVAKKRAKTITEGDDSADDAEPPDAKTPRERHKSGESKGKQRRRKTNKIADEIADDTEESEDDARARRIRDLAKEIIVNEAKQTEVRDAEKGGGELVPTRHSDDFANGPSYSVPESAFDPNEYADLKDEHEALLDELDGLVAEAIEARWAKTKEEMADLTPEEQAADEEAVRERLLARAAQGLTNRRFRVLTEEMSGSPNLKAKITRQVLSAMDKGLAKQAIKDLDAILKSSLALAPDVKAADQSLREAASKTTAGRTEADEYRSDKMGGTIAKAAIKRRLNPVLRASQGSTEIRAQVDRALKSLEKLSKSAAETVALYRQNQARAEAGRMLGKDATREQMIALANEIARLDFTNPRAIGEIQHLVNKPSAAERVHRYRVASMLSGISSVTVDMIGTATNNLLFRPAARLAGAGWDAIFHRDERSATLAMVGAELGGYRAAFGGALREFGLTFRTGVSSRQMRDIRSYSGDAFGGILRPLNYGMRLRSASDDMQRHLALWGAATAYAAREAGRTGKSLDYVLANLTESPWVGELAGREADKATFQGRLTGVLQGVAHARHSSLVVKFVIPFFETLANILTTGADMSGYGFVRARRTMAEARKFETEHPNETAHGKREEAARLRGEAVLGMTVMGLSFAATLAGGMTAYGPEDDDERKDWLDQGGATFSFDLGGGHAVKYIQIAGPLAVPMAIGSSLAEALASAQRKAKTEERLLKPREEIIAGLVFNTAAGTIGNVLKFGMDTTGLRGVSDLVSLATNPGQSAVYKRVIANAATSYVPLSGFWANIDRATDDKVRDSFGLLDPLAARLPVASQSLAPSRTQLGDEVRRGNSGVAALGPFQWTAGYESPLLKETQRVRAEGFKVGVGETGSSALGVGLQGRERNEYQRLAGETTKEYLTKLYAADTYKRASDAVRAKMIETMVSRARKAAGKEMIQQIGSAEVKRRILAQHPEKRRETLTEIETAFAAGGK